MKKTLFLLLGIFLTFSLASAQDPTVTVPEGETVKVAVVGDLSNILPSSGLGIAQAAELAIQQFNEKGGLKGFELELVIEDDLCDPEAAAEVAESLIEDGEVVAVVGHLCSGATLAAAERYQEARIPMISASSTAARVTEQGWDVVNRTVLSDNLQGIVGARYLHSELKAEKIVILHNQTPYGEGLAEIVDKTFTELGGEVVWNQGFDAAEADYAELVEMIAQANPDALYLAGYSIEAATLREEVILQGLDELIFFSVDGAFTPDFLAFGGEFTEGAYATSFLQRGEPGRNRRFITAYEARFGISPEDLGPYHAQAYDGLNIILQALEKASELDEDGNLIIERETLIEAIRNTRRYRGLTGTITCNEVGECGAGEIVVYQVQDGAWVALEVPEDLQVHAD